MSTRLSNPAPEFFYQGTNQPLSGGLMYFYVPGSTLTPKDTYSDNGLSIANSNPIKLPPSGILPNVYLNGAYRVILTDANGVQQWDRDSVNSVAGIAGIAWDSTITYGLGGTNIVYASDGNYYVSIQAGNLGNNPANNASPLWWQDQFDYLAKDQQIVAAKSVAVGNATTGLTGVAIANGRTVIGDTTNGIAALNTTTKGTIAVGNGTTTTTLAVGTDTFVFTADSAQATGTKWAAAPTANFVLLATVNPTAAANIDFLTTFSASYNRYLIVGEGLTVGTSGALLLRFANAGTADTGSNYANPAINSTTAATATSITMGSFSISSAGKGASFQVLVENANDATNLKIITGYIVGVSGAGPNYDANTIASAYFAANAISGFRLLLAGGVNFAAAGAVRVYGLIN